MKFRVYDNKEKKYSEDFFLMGIDGILYYQTQTGHVEAVPKNRFICEFSTGLLDRNKKELFAGDRFKNISKATYFLVVWDAANARFGCIWEHHPDYGIMRLSQEWLNKTEAETIGSIHDKEGK